MISQFFMIWARCPRC